MTPHSTSPQSAPDASNSPFLQANTGGETSPPLGSTHYETHRRLDEPVLPSAAEEALVDTPSTFTSSSNSAGRAAWPFPDGEPTDNAAAWLSRMEDQVTHYVTEQPLKAALMAVGAGAVAAWLLGRGMSRTSNASMSRSPRGRRS